MVTGSMASPQVLLHLLCAKITGLKDDGTFGPYNSAKAVVHLYPHSDTGLSARKSSAVNLGTLKIGDASLYYLEQGIPGLELMMLHCVARSSSDRVVFGQIHESSHPLDISPDRSSLLASA
ncbi:hypothetical protein LSH36_555g02032 [Paralvinella palmiformis]|uniref:Uncharacterized protein n=1 Tax=Paralvinella palmiformis TaxID=53620 RepID=A0AAD9J814_9ANNE|nr:hypothetical protein LSH36_555g02032 [Paralvinella palmiformis]